MSDNLNSAKSADERESLAGRLPVLPGERIYNGYMPYMWSGVTFAAATYAFLLGGALPFVGNTKLGIAGYIVGLIIGMVPIQLAMGIPSFRFGIDGIDVCKSSFGTRGVIVPLIGALAASLGWTYVVFALTGRGAATVIQTVKGAGAPNETMVVFVALVALLGTWLIASKGPRVLERMANYISPGHLIITAIMLALLYAKYGAALWDMNVDPSKALTHDSTTAVAYGVEFGFANGLSWWPFSGGLSRLVKRRGIIMGPMVLGTGVVGSGFLAMVASYAAVSAGTPDPTVWMIQVGGNYLGTAIMTFVLLANIATSVILIYQAGVSIQQIRLFSRIRWPLVVAILLAPGLWVSFHTQLTLDSTMTWLAYNGTIFSGLLAVTFVDYLILRREHIDIDHIFTRSSHGKYWFWGGVNWIAIAVCAGAVVLYMLPYDPITLAVKPWFRYLGAGIPATVVSGIVYYVLMKLFVVRSSKGHYPARTGTVAVRNEEAPPLSL
ncbi:cytosine permease [Burkholderia multivorans]|uniref:cytosine permease n=1 Tax=Burkholderia multivorans TaxID=87883 RepID=UPI0020192385|nr:cytosine permease [Burkholderia multivorans]MCO1374637.1 cytosine permease [Burkholderia multivorans]MCO1459780.1 cytosine permease [Burkholderia multivorans]UQO21214.1 cytosine permease [Burkholderia multivorans]UQO87454.1 cytosine permease [Burkholderia multivorans]